MKTKIVGIFVCMLLIATALPAVGTMNENEIPASFGMGGNSLNHQSTPRSIMSNNRGGMFIQLPPHPEAPDTTSWTSDLRLGYQVYDDFWDVTDSICDIHWWGCSFFWTGSGWELSDPPVDMTFNISFHNDANGMPGDIVCSYIDVLPLMTKTGIYYWSIAGFYKQLLYFEYDLEPCCDLLNGWVSIVCTGNEIDGHFLWMHSYDGNDNAFQGPPMDQLNDDLSFVLTDDGVPDIPDLECDGELSWTDVKPGDNVTGDFVVRNNGAAGSILHWKVESYPNWGSNWTFTPNASILTIGADWITVNVSVTAPDDPNEEFTGEVKLVNVMDSSDSCTIDVSLATPKNKAFDFNYPILSWLFERFPNAFPILRQVLGL